MTGKPDNTNEGPRGAVERRAQRLARNLIADAESLARDLDRFVALVARDNFLGTHQLVQAAVDLDRDARYLTGLRDGLDYEGSR